MVHLGQLHDGLGAVHRHLIVVCHLCFTLLDLQIVHRGGISYRTAMELIYSAFAMVGAYRTRQGMSIHQSVYGSFTQSFGLGFIVVPCAAICHRHRDGSFVHRQVILAGVVRILRMRNHNGYVGHTYIGT